MIKLTSSYEIYIKKLFELMVFILIIILGVTIMGCEKEFFKREPPKQPVDVKIIVWQKGKKAVLKPDSPHFKELQTASEEMLTSASDALRLAVQPKDIIKIKENEFSLEVIYAKTKKFKVYFPRENTIKISRLLIPLSGEYAYPPRTTVFWGEIATYSAGPYLTEKNPNKIKTLLRTMNITR